MSRCVWQEVNILTLPSGLSAATLDSTRIWRTGKTLPDPLLSDELDRLAMWKHMFDWIFIWQLKKYTYDCGGSQCVSLGCSTTPPLELHPRNYSIRNKLKEQGSPRHTWQSHCGITKSKDAQHTTRDTTTSTSLQPLRRNQKKSTKMYKTIYNIKQEIVHKINLKQLT